MVNNYVHWLYSRRASFVSENTKCRFSRDLMIICVFYHWNRLVHFVLPKHVHLYSANNFIEPVNLT